MIISTDRISDSFINEALTYSPKDRLIRFFYPDVNQ